MSPVGYYQIKKPVDASYNDTLEVVITVPRGENLRSRIGGALAIALTPLGIANSGSLEPAEALKRNQNTQAA